MTGAVGVVIPAAEEETTIGGCLESVLVAADVLSTAGVAVLVTVVLDGCTDGTADVVAGFPEVESVVSGRRNVGYSRRVGASRTLPRLDHDGLLVSTDADSRVPADWLVLLHRFAATTDLVLGTVVPEPGLPADVEREWYLRHDLRDGHPYVHGANLAIRAEAYRVLGGWAPLATGEDVDLADRAVRAGMRVHRTARAAVATSTRAVGRAPHGFSSYLRELGHVAPEPLAG